MKNKTTNWETSSEWYDKVVGNKGHYYHEHLILPKVTSWFRKTELTSLIDLACGNGILSRYISKDVHYLGLDGSPSLIKSALQQKATPSHEFKVQDLMQPFDSSKKFSHAACILAIQNLQDPLPLFETAARCLKEKGLFIIVLNHPCFRIPRQSSWGIDIEKKTQYRRIDRYMSPLEIPIQTHPGHGEKPCQTWSFHHPLSLFVSHLSKAGFCLLDLEEWCSDKVSQGKQATMENRSRKEFPLFLTLIAKKLSS
ncbi:MAG: hypothetical protein RLZZ453_228 [Chlamydiota bacterium]|jgi:SAM-dependent methyltransferase